MTDTPSAVLLLRIQSTGSNTNLWGGYLNTNQQILEQASKGYQTLDCTSGSQTISWTNYTTGNTGQCAHLKLTGSPTAALTLTMPSLQNRVLVNNTTSQTATIKCSGGTGVSVPANRRCEVRCDGTDYTTDTPTWTGDVLTLTNNGDLVTNAQMTASISAISTAQSGLVLNSSSAPAGSANYLNNLLTTQVGSLTTGQISGLNTLQIAKINGGTASEQTAVTPGNGYVDGFIHGGRFTGPTTLAVGYHMDFVSGCTITLPSSPTQGAKCSLALFNPSATYSLDPNGNKINNSTSALTVPGGSTFVIAYDQSLGDWE